MRGTEIEAVGELAGEALAVAGTLARDLHEGIAGRPFSILGPAAAPVRVVHDGISRAVYAGVREGLRGVAQAGAKVLAARADADAPPLASRPRTALALGALNGLYGNHLAQRSSELALEMELRVDGAATPRIAVFVHGLCETDDSWRLISHRSEDRDRRSYGERLRDELGFTPVYLRYNTGLHISDNGRALAERLDQLVRRWPVAVDELVLIGHSMGGLVARSACHYGERDELSWTGAVRHVFCLGTPHLGADLEKGVSVLGWALGRLPETRGLARVINARSAGIKDLRFGSCAEADWSDCDPDEFLRDRCGEVPFMASANYYFIGAALSPDPVGRLLGDLLVRMPSASGRGSGRGRRIPFEVDNGHELHGLTHFDLLGHSAVYEQLRTWITRPPKRD